MQRNYTTRARLSRNSLRAALALLARGYRVVPVWWPGSNGTSCGCGNPACEHPAKHPIGLLVPHGIRDATALPATAKEWIARFPEMNLAVATGTASGVVVLDVDEKYGGLDSLAKWEADHGVLPDTPTVRTGGGGRHYHFRCADTLQSQGALDGYPGLEIRGDGGSAIVPPSRHASGAEYAWTSPEECPLADLPDALRDAANTRRAPLALNGEDAEPIPKGQRHAALVSLAGTLRHRLIPEEILAALREVNRRRCVPPVLESELLSIAKSARAWPVTHPLTAQQDPAAKGTARLLFPDPRPADRVPTSPHALPASAQGRNAAPDPRWTPRPLSALSLEGTDMPWVLRGYIARGATTNWTGLWKVGKTTWLSRLLKALDGRAQVFCGQPVGSATVLVVSEEPERLWALRRDELEIGDHVQVITRPFLGRPDSRAWEQFIAHVANQVKARGHGLMVLDALPNLWPVRDENDAAVVLTALTPLNAITEAGAAVLLITHPAKTDAGEGRATCGSGALGGFVDVIVEMRRFDPERRDDTRRVLTTYSRFDEPPEVVLAFDREAGYSVVGTKANARAEDRTATALELLPDAPPGATTEELLERWPAEGAPRPGKRTLSGDLNAAVERGAIQRTGSGKKGDPHRYYGADPIPASPPPYPPSLPEMNLGASELPEPDKSRDPLVERAVQVFGSKVVEVRPTPMRNGPLS